jgi:MFS family permease
VTGIMEPEPTSGTTSEVRSTGAHLIVSVGVGTLGGPLFGFDTMVIAGTTHDPTRTFHRSPGMLGITVSTALLGTIIGSLGVGTPGQRFSSRAVPLHGCALSRLCTRVRLRLELARTTVLALIGGLGIGGSSVLGPVYIAEIAPARHRVVSSVCFSSVSWPASCSLTYRITSWRGGFTLYRNGDGSQVSQRRQPSSLAGLLQ